MKRIICLVAVAAMSVTGAQVFGFGFPSVPSIGGGGSGEKVDVEALTAREGILKIRVNKATVALANGLIEVQRSCGMGAEAAKLEAIKAEAEKNPSDSEGTKNLCAAVNNAGDSLKQVDLEANMNKAEARKHLGKSLLFLGAGSLLDLQATNDAKKLVADISNGIKAVQASPVTYGFSSAKNLTSGLSTATFVVKTIPGQIITTVDLTKGLTKYAQTNKIEIPSKQEQESQAAAMGKGE